jgi:hypothetical protein
VLSGCDMVTEDMQDDDPLASNKSKSKRKVDDTDDSSDIEYVGMTPSRKQRAREAKRAKSKAVTDDSEVEVVAVTPSRKKKAKQPQSSPPSSPEKKNKKKTLSEGVLATWGKGDDDMEPSTKMLALLEYLKLWDATGEKTICYSQCETILLLPIRSWK